MQAVISTKYYTKYLAVMKLHPSHFDPTVSPLTSESGVPITCTAAASFEVWKDHQRKELDGYVGVPSQLIIHCYC